MIKKMTIILVNLIYYYIINIIKFKVNLFFIKQILMVLFILYLAFKEEEIITNNFLVDLQRALLYQFLSF